MVNPIGGESENTAVGMNALHDNLAYGDCALGFAARAHKFILLNKSESW